VATFGLLLFPDGRLPSPRWRPAAALAAVGLAGLVVGPALTPFSTDHGQRHDPLGVDAIQWLPKAITASATIAFLLAVLAAVASLRARYRAARADERQQLKWLVYAGALVGLSVLVTVPVEAAFGSGVDDFTNATTTFALSTVPIAMGIAILRHRLYDVDLVIRRTLVYGVLTATLGATYLALVLLIGLAVGRSGFAVAVSTLAVAGLFRPALARIQGAVDRRFYRRRYDAARTLEAFGGRLREELDLEALAEDLRGVVHETVQPVHVSLWLRSRR
jgi:hypothetical protein